MVTGVGGAGPLRMPQEIPGLDQSLGGRALDPSAGVGPGGGVGGANGAAGVTGASFGDSMKNFLGGVNDLALRSDRVFQSFVRGEVKDLHQVALAQQEAGIAVRLVAEMRDKLIGAYQEIMRMQM